MKTYVNTTRVFVVLLLYVVNCNATVCGIGQYSDGEGGRCLFCDVGSSTADVGSNSSNACVPCAAGTFSIGRGVTCSPCPRGTASNEIGVGECQVCPVGYAAPELGSTSCTKCRPGTYAYKKWSTECKNCPPDTFTQYFGAGSCSPCPLGYRSLGDGKGSCKGCPRNNIDNPYYAASLQKEWSWTEYGCVKKCLENAYIHTSFMGRFGFIEGKCVRNTTEYSRLWGTPIVPEFLPLPWRMEDIAGILERNPHMVYGDWMFQTPTNTNVTTQPVPTTTPILNITHTTTSTPTSLVNDTTDTQSTLDVYYEITRSSSSLREFPLWVLIVGSVSVLIVII